MGKRLSEMTLEELWKLFPIFLTEHNGQWKDYYIEIETFLKDILTDYKIKRISHIGSTAISNIWAKPIIDILVEIDTNENIENVANVIEINGFIRMSSEKNRISFNRGYTENGFSEKVYHLHLRYVGDNSELYFRDYLNEYQEIAKAYERLKLDLWKQYEYNRNGYTEAKTAFIAQYTEEAKRAYQNRYC